MKKWFAIGKLAASAAALIGFLFCAGKPVAAAVLLQGDVTPNPLVDEVAVSVGDNSYGEVSVDAGSTLNSPTLAIGDPLAAAHGVVQVTGPESEWTIGDRIDLASAGIGRLLISGGGSVNTADLYGAFAPTSLAEIDIANSGSRLRISNQIAIGQGGFADIKIRNGATFDAIDAYVSFHSGTRVALDDAVLRASQLDLAGRLRGSGTVVVQSGVQVNNGSIEVEESDHLNILAGVDNRGRIEISNGELELLGLQNSQQGYITLNGGILRLPGQTFDPPGFSNRATFAAIGGTNDLYGGVSNLNDGVVSIANGSLLRVHGDVVNENGTFSIGSGSKALVLGDFTMFGGTLLANLDGEATNPNGELEVIGDLRLDGYLDISAAIGYTPEAGDQFRIATATGDIEGQLTLESAPVLPNDLHWRLTREGNALLLGVSLPGDYNGDSVVNLADYTVWRDSLGSYGPWLVADGSGPDGFPDGEVNALDYQLWKANFGRVANTSLVVNPSAIPEAGSQTILVILGISCIFFLRPLGTVRQ